MKPILKLTLSFRISVATLDTPMHLLNEHKLWSSVIKTIPVSFFGHWGMKVVMVRIMMLLRGISEEQIHPDHYITNQLLDIFGTGLVGKMANAFQMWFGSCTL